MNTYTIKPGCLYSTWDEQSSWNSFYHEECGPSGSGPSKTSQKLALWYPGIVTDWPYLALQGLTLQDLMDHYQCTLEDAKKAMEYIFHFQVDVESRFL